MTFKHYWNYYRDEYVRSPLIDERSLQAMAQLFFERGQESMRGQAVVSDLLKAPQSHESRLLSSVEETK